MQNLSLPYSDLPFGHSCATRPFSPARRSFSTRTTHGHTTGHQSATIHSFSAALRTTLPYIPSTIRKPRPRICRMPHTHSISRTLSPVKYTVFSLSITMKLTSLLVLAGLPAGSAFVAPAKVFHGAGVGAARGSTERSSGSCQMMARVPFIAGNWKMNPLDLGTAKDLAKAVS